jgi:hypothetical protein
MGSFTRTATIYLLLITGMLASLLISCSTVRETGLIPEDQLFVTRKYAGNFVGYSNAEPYYRGGPKVILITTTLDTVYGKISAYSVKCDFRPGERLYIRKVYQSTGVFGNWKYQIENDTEKKVSYGIMEFRYGDKILVQNWF